MEKINIFIGLDEPHKIAYDVCKYSIETNNKKYKLKIQPINYNTITEYNRKKDEFESTQFSFARFFAPYLCEYKGISIFCDGDFLFLNSIDELIDLYDSEYAVMCCKHDYVPANQIKMGNKKQSIFPKKNWSSLMIFNNEHPKIKTLNPLTLNNQSGGFLHQFKYLDDVEIGSLPLQWNWLVDYYSEPKDGTPKALHFTDGGPWLEQYKKCEYSNLWFDFKNKIS
jgi:lipopolysaccharide biosynthesis glycosyltransferase